MARIVYNKHVRDRFPEIIAGSGKTCEMATMSFDEFERALLEKLVEEARESQQADDEHLKTELADLSEVMDALLAVKGIPRDALRAEQRLRRKERGSFKKRLKLIWTE